MHAFVHPLVHSLAWRALGSTSTILQFARVVRDPNAKENKDALAEKPAKVQVVMAADLVQIVAKDVRMNPQDLGPTEEFETDAAIGRGRGG